MIALVHLKEMEVRRLEAHSRSLILFQIILQNKVHWLLVVVVVVVVVVSSPPTTYQ
jgi:sugar phosphate permease